MSPPPALALSPHHVPAPSLKALAVGWLAGLDEVFLFHLRAEVGPVQPPKHPGDQEARMRQPVSGTHQTSPIGLGFAALLRRTGVKQIWKEIIIFAPFLAAVYRTAAKKKMWV